ncbi:MAG: efflux RND transporter periplasmic adaptor subunit [Ignavibacteriae bacterium]|nr:MAG: efflux RND transporter periplasmic adaptor subunit [Ignavibacteriota bacterium]
MKTNLKYFLIILTLGALVFGAYSCNKAKSSDQASAAKTISTSYSVSVITAAKKDLTDSFSQVGTIVAYNDVAVMSETSGRVVKISAEVGDYKHAGDVLVEVDSELKEAAYKTAKVSYEKAKKDLERYEALYKEGSIPDTQIEQARWSFQSTEAQYIVARRQLSDTKITTPISGFVTARNVNIGSMVMGAPQATFVANVVDISRLKVKVNVAEKDVIRLKVGEKVEVTTDVFPNSVFTGSIFSVSSKGDEGHTYPVEVVLNNSKMQIKAGMFGRVKFTPKISGAAIVIPRESIVGSIRDAAVYVIKDNAAKLRPVVAGKELGTDIEILNGLNEGEQVVVNGQNNLSDNAPVIVRK